MLNHKHFKESKPDWKSGVFFLLILLAVIIIIIIAFGIQDAHGQTWNPVDFKKWQNGEQFRKRIGGQYANYERAGDSGWAAIDNNWVASGDSAYECNTSILKTHVDSSGKSIISIRWGENTYTAISKLNRLMWLRTDTWDTLTIFTNPNWSNHSKDSNVVKWTNVFPAVDYRIRKRNGQVEHGIFFKKAFLDSAVVLYNQRADSIHIALANVIVYTLSANIDNADVALGNLNKRKLKDWGYHYFGLDEAQLFFPGSDTLRTVSVNHRWLKWNNKIICVEYIMMSKIKQIHEAYPNAVIWHNDIAKIEGTTNVEDALMDLGNPDYNYGSRTTLRNQSTTKRFLVRVKNVASELGIGATISACLCSLYCETKYTDGNIGIYRIFKPWGEGALDNVDPDDAAEGEGIATWNDWSNDDEEWATAGCGSADDGGSDNSGDGTGADRKATAEDLVYVNATGWWSWDISAALAQGWYDETINEEGLYFGDPDNTAFSVYCSTEYGSNQPYWVFTYTTDGEEAAPSRRRRILQILGGK